jgi:hypothetical protein
VLSTVLGAKLCFLLASYNREAKLKFVIFLGVAAAVVWLSSSFAQHIELYRGLPSQTLVPDLELSRSVVVSEPGCDATAFAQVPDDRSLFIGRQSITAEGRLAGVNGPNDCSGGDRKNEAAGKPYDRWGLVLDSFNWRTKQFSIVKPLIDTSVDPHTGRSHAMIIGGPMQGLIIRSAYDPSLTKFGKNEFVAFECTFENGERYGVDQTSSCLAVFDPVNRSIDMSRVTVVVSGDRDGDTFHAASLPRLLSFHGKLYLYWAATTVRQGRILRSAERGAELTVGTGLPAIRGTENRIPRSLDPASTEVWAPEDSPSSNLIANITSFTPQDDSFLVLGVLGGSGCETPGGSSPGCFRLTMKSSSDPLAPLTFNRAQSVGTALPTNPEEYAIPTIDSQGRWWILAHFIRPQSNGFAGRAPAPPISFWNRTTQPSALTLIPTRLKN